MGQKIAIREAELGPVIARADHLEQVVEVNKDIFYQLPQNVQEFVLCHEVCHLRHNEWDEDRTNALAAQLFLSRAVDAADRQERQRFLSYVDDNGGYTNFDVLALIPSLVSLGYSIYGAIAGSNAGWYSWTRAAQRSNLNAMLTSAFAQSRRSGSKSAADFFWVQMQKFTNKDQSLDQFLARSDNKWVRPVITKYEKAYGFGFEEVTPIDLKAFPLVMVAVGLVVGFLAYKIIKKARK